MAYLNNVGKVTKIIHRTWKNSIIPESIFPKSWTDSWSIMHPSWKIMLWTDEDNLNFIKNYFPEYLNLYNSYDMNIKRADIARYLILYKFGGLYVDLDCIALRAIDPLIKDSIIFFGVEPKVYWHRTKNKPLLSNAFMYSKPGHHFWRSVLEEAKTNKEELDPVNQTGPALLTHSYEKFENSIFTLSKNDEFIWSCTPDEKDITKLKFFGNKIITLDTFVVHVSTLTWTSRKQTAIC